MQPTNDEIKELFNAETRRTGDRSGFDFALMEYNYNGAWDYTLDNKTNY